MTRSFSVLARMAMPCLTCGCFVPQGALRPAYAPRASVSTRRTAQSTTVCGEPTWRREVVTVVSVTDADGDSADASIPLSARPRARTEAMCGRSTTGGVGVFHLDT